MSRNLMCIPVALLLCAGVAVAQEPQPTVAPFPLELRRMPSGFSNKDREELQAEFRRLVRSAGAMVPNAGSMDSALLALKRQDCDRENECLQLLAQKAQTLYGLFGSIDYDLAKNVVATGRIVREDGKLMGELRTITIPKGNDPFIAVARVALAQLLSAMKVKELPPFREAPSTVVEVKKPDEVVKPAEAVVGGPPTVTEPANDNSGMRTGGYVLAGVGVATAITGGILLGLGHASSGLNNNNVITDRSTYLGSQTEQSAGVALLTVGVAVGVAGGVLVFLNPRQTVAIAPAVGPHGVGVVVGGSF